MTDRRAVVLVSGGLDSATVLGMCRAENREVHAISFDYGQRHRFELDAAKAVCATENVARHIVFPLDLSAFGGSALTDRTGEIVVPKERGDEEMETGIPVTYVPARNTVFLAIALGWAEVLGIGDLFIGVNAVDYSGYPDCRPDFIQAFEQTANLATKAGVENSIRFAIHTPLIALTKTQIIRRGIELGVDYSLTHSCYDPDANGGACRHCDACVLRARGFSESGVADPTRYGESA